MTNTTGVRERGVATRLLVACAVVVASIMTAPEGPAVASPDMAVDRSTVISQKVMTIGGRTLTNAPVRLLWDGEVTGGKLRELVRSASSADGRLKLDWTPTAADLAKARVNGGWFNFEVFVGSGGSTGVTFVPRRWTGNGWVGVDGAVGSARLGEAPIEVALGDMRVKDMAQRQRIARGGTVHVHWRRDYWTRVANVPSGRDMKTDFTYGRAGDSEIEAMADNGAGWFTSGTTKVSNEEAMVHGLVGGARTSQISVTVQYEKVSGCVAGWYCYTRIRARHWTGGLRGKKITNWSCRHGKKSTVYKYPLVQGIRKYRGENRTYSTGASVAGFGLSAKSGYGSSVDMTIDFRIPGGVNNNRFCIGGSTGAWTTARTIYASSWRG